MKTKEIINISVLPNEPTDGSGRVCIHLFVKDEAGPFVEPHVLHMLPDENGHLRMVAKPTRGRLACDPRRTVAEVVRGHTKTVTMRTDDPRATTCLKCKASKDYAEIMAQLNK